MYNGWETHLVRTALQKRLEEIRSELIRTPLSAMHRILELNAEIDKNEIMLEKLNHNISPITGEQIGNTSPTPLP
ncbi:hypothetical protein SIN8267_01514 [Sinobacterium norvegicum]|uniref:Uncharacterized protein n=1 Tax=Sinobacterium norvegicum TaxID=1641715 RepID=A0ABN8EJV0_9GAMM|nr:hypothetical protein [Sinobacterium norvegicum]CAH0991410.1 hypothetical protein SIN8267_01514 [Sinobacterium norvegicum]